jgi:hypothetical protein
MSKSRIKYCLTVACAILVTVITGCNQDDGHTPGPITSTAGFTLSGTLEGNKSGEAVVFKSVTDGFHRLTFNFSDSNAAGNSSFSLDLVQGPDTAVISLPAPGIYSIGGAINDADFTAIYSDVGLGISFIGEGEGELTISTVGDEFIEGNFEFSLSALTIPSNSIQVSNGSFRALIIE